MDENTRGQSFGFRAGYQMAIVTFAVNIDTMLRFPHYCMYYGGGAFFIPYFLAMIILGVFSVYLETLIGQITKLGPLQAWNKLLPPMKVNANTFNISTCNNTWNSPNCTVSYNFSCLPNATLPSNVSMTMLPTTLPTTQAATVMNSTPVGNLSNITTTPVTPLIPCPQYKGLMSNLAEAEFFRNYAFEGTPAPNQLGSLIPSLVACSLIAWLITFVIMLVGLRSLRFFGFLLVILSFAFIIMMIIVIQDLDGARDGILYLVTPHYSYLLQPSTWAIAGLHAIWTLSVGYGTYAHFGYRNKANTNPFWSALITVAIVAFFQFFVAYCIFAYVGFIGKQTNQLKFVLQNLDQGIGLLFIILPIFTNFIPEMVHWLGFYYIIFVLIAAGTQAMLLETVSSIIYDELPEKVRAYKWPVRLILSYVVLGFSLFCEIQNGYHILTAMGKVIQDWSIIMLILQSLTLAYVFGMGTRIESNMAKYNRPRMLIFWLTGSIIVALLAILLFIYYQIYNVTINRPSDLAMAKVMFYIILGISGGILVTVMIVKLMGVCDQSVGQEDNQLNMDVGFKRRSPARRDTGVQRLVGNREE
ncbi:Sodium- and chloride-dependent glycine transporter 2 [Trichoplax sp. H2]|nr:Sodium- and chloride-dependent glycine transporter 2 [Trichoplax sp. H2]|eukprot:RDD40368.1 Sodium- and chloride-dependent glycine transporter 2 [Trichoplax sp. H2]